MLSSKIQRTARKMAISSPFTQAVVASMRKLYPEALADRSFDNTGLLLEAPFNPAQRQKNSVLLTIDLTRAVADEAIARQASCVIAYHPIIFRGLKSLTLKDTQQQSLLRLAAQGISVYSPHTAVDAAPGGLGDWLADIVTGQPANMDVTPTTTGLKASKHTLEHYPSTDTRALDLAVVEHERSPIKKVNANGVHGAGMGRIVRFSSASPLTDIVDRIALGLGNPNGFSVAVPQGKSIDEVMIKSVGICAGSGGHLFSEMESNGDEVDLLFTGELSHHEALAAIEKDKSVICTFHSNSERGFLHTVLKSQLEDTIKEEWTRLQQEGSSDETLKEVYDDESVEVHISEVDRDPYGILMRN